MMPYFQGKGHKVGFRLVQVSHDYYYQIEREKVDTMFG